MRGRRIVNNFAILRITRNNKTGVEEVFGQSSGRIGRDELNIASAHEPEVTFLESFGLAKLFDRLLEKSVCCLTKYAEKVRLINSFSSV